MSTQVRAVECGKVENIAYLGIFICGISRLLLDLAVAVFSHALALAHASRHTFIIGRRGVKGEGAGGGTRLLRNASARRLAQSSLNAVRYEELLCWNRRMQST